MNNIELENLVREIVIAVLQYLENDPRFRQSAQPQQMARRVQVNKNLAAKKLYVERDIVLLAKQGMRELRIPQKTIVTPAAQDAAREKGIVIIRE